MINYILEKAHRSFLLIFVCLLLLMGIGAVIQLNHISSEQEDIRNQSVELRELDGLLFDLETTLQQVVIQGRGYYIYQEEAILENLNTEITELESILADYQALDSTRKNEEFGQAIDAFITRYSEEWIPQVTAQIENGGGEISAVTSGEINDQANRIIDQTTEEYTAIESERAAINDDYFASTIQANNSILLYFVLILLVLGVSVWTLLYWLTKPLQDLEEAADKIETGEDVELKYTKRKDEMGALSRTFSQMAASIQNNQEMLTDRNEELESQQEELELQRERLHQMNEFNSSLSAVSEKNELLQTILVHFQELFPFEKAMILTMQPEWMTASLGMSDARVKWLTEHIEETPAMITYETKAPHMVKVQADASEQGLSEESRDMYELYMPIFSEGEHLIGICCMYRIGRPFSQEEQHAMFGLLSQSKISFERIILHETTEKDSALYQAIINNVNEGIQFIDAKGRMIHSNSKMDQIAGKCALKKSQKPSFERWTSGLLSHVDEKDRSMLEAYFYSYREGEKPNIEKVYYHVHDEEEVRVYEVYGEQLFSDGELQGTIFVHRDHTRNYELDKMKSDLVSTVSHELRTPLSSILGFAELMLMKELKPEKQRKYIETIHKEGNRLTHLINDFLDLQRMESGKESYEKERVDAAEIIMNVVHTMEPGQPNHSFIIEDKLQSGKIFADEDKLVQVMTNLISNAVKFSPNGGNITISMQNSQDNVMVSVTDQGLGIPEKELPKLFSKFHRVEGEKRQKIRGTGLGLAVCKKILEDHNGRIMVTSEEGKGSTFTFYLPALDGEELLQYTQSDSTLTALVLEDDRSLGLLLSEELRHAKYEVAFHFNPTAALAAIDSGLKPDIFIVDVMLGDEMDGWTFIQHIKAREELKNIPIIVSSALNEDTEKMQELEVHHYLTKPYPPQKLSQQVRYLLKKTNPSGEIYVPSVKE
ncbi:HAMP domain-containing protein [Sinobaca qinghaiensis]|uniref:histidine kinase n=1 Tax=Sinobaca qinghaiensis TaxID=342944 RepID=A0A419UZZ7_9BACL|nr:ATP-binding protein [Sinobaca qinghaiensis]RKD71265.1 HAMP domain-containing protein [Sinobaca qinghaiensis]